ncbi:phosphoribosyl 1,2-cyclic phosphodiesterase [Roseibium aquae]|uniref:Phosphoribosyl 1,2-cyclic phosphodiesterase n=1 Tax=Roseibium aquae TaxID=1323746 RepID=A0A916X0U7_9HYPH|nr:MBL fold metallo-hydrolase [Roseibium aquae]GGB44727.1 phosphoribosyl 1,2-cyclic phosphodiesterase [Roseibium aquae]
MNAALTVTILGCGSSGGVPRIGNDWGQCDPREPRNRRLRCSILVERASAAGKTRVLVDTGPDLREQMLRAEISELDGVLYTHSHADHLHGIDDLRVFTIRNRKRMPVYMDRPTYDRAATAFGYCFASPPGSAYPPILDFHGLHAGQAVAVSGEGGEIPALPVEVEHGDINALGFRFGDLGYLPDVSDIPDDAVPHFQGLQTLIIDALRHRPHPSHFCLDDALSWIERLAPARAILTNMHNDMDYATLCTGLPPHVTPAFDGMQVRADCHDLAQAPGRHGLCL